MTQTTEYQKKVKKAIRILTFGGFAPNVETTDEQIIEAAENLKHLTDTLGVKFV